MPSSVIGFFAGVALWVICYIFDIEPWMVGGRRYTARHRRKSRG